MPERSNRETAGEVFDEKSETLEIRNSLNSAGVRSRLRRRHRDERHCPNLRLPSLTPKVDKLSSIERSVGVEVYSPIRTFRRKRSERDPRRENALCRERSVRRARCLQYRSQDGQFIQRAGSLPARRSPRGQATGSFDRSAE